MQAKVDYSKCRVRVTRSSGNGNAAMPDIKHDDSRVGLIVILGSGSVVSFQDGEGTTGIISGWSAAIVGGNAYTSLNPEFHRDTHGELPSLPFWASDNSTYFVQILDVAGAYRDASIPAS